jgi:cytochrome c oxidase cbb3-type subunit 1
MGSIYFLVPRLFGQKQMYSKKAIEVHFWLATIGIVLYITAMWISGVTAGLMWRAMNDDGTLTYTFAESVKSMHPFYIIRMFGGLLYLSGMVIMLWNVLKTVSIGTTAVAKIPSTAVHA